MYKSKDVHYFIQKYKLDSYEVTTASGYAISKKGLNYYFFTCKK